MPGGQPTKYTADMPDKLIAAMESGKSAVRFAKDVRVHVDTLYEWAKVHPEFSDAFRKARGYCEAHWEEWLVNNLENKNVNSGLVKLFMSNRFGWTEKKESHVTAVVKQEDALKELE
jgi:hypothetical protein